MTSKLFVVFMIMLATSATALAQQAAPAAAAGSGASAAPASTAPAPATPAPSAGPAAVNASAPAPTLAPSPEPQVAASPPAQPLGYGYGASRSLIAEQIVELERQRAELSLGGYIAMLIGGGVVGLTGASVLLFGLLVQSYCGDYDDSTLNNCDEHDSLVPIGLAIGVVGAVVGGLGLGFMIDRISERRALALQIRKLRSQQQMEGPTLGLMLAPSGGTATLRLRF